MLGFLLVDKPSGPTSHDLVYTARRALGVKRVGHSGTLDPAASGLLILAVGPATRLLKYLDDEPKVYTGIVRLGIETTTQDAEGEVVKTANPSGVTDSQIADAVREMQGELEQIPPMYSAVKVAGRPLYKLARAGVAVERHARKVTIHEFAIVGRAGEELEFRVECSSGTYVRTLAHDLGHKLGVGGHLSLLRRVRMGPYRVEDAVAPDNIGEMRVIEPSRMLRHLPSHPVTPDEAASLNVGRAIPSDPELNGDLVLCLEGGVLLCVARRRNGVWHPEVVLR